MDFNYIQRFGFSEMYEVSNTEQSEYGRFVMFDPENPGKICWVNNKQISKPDILGVTSINFCGLSDNPLQWPGRYMYNEVGDAYMMQDEIVIGKKAYDDIYEMAYIKTQKQKVFKPIESDEYDKNKTYNQRIDREEWMSVNILGKCIVVDDGECDAGDYCTIYIGDDSDLFGTAVKYTGNDMPKYYVIRRISEKTIMIKI